MPTITIQEQIATEALRDVMKSISLETAQIMAKDALRRIDEINTPTVHHLNAAPLIVDTPPGGGA
jgi:hypothetical protein